MCVCFCVSGMQEFFYCELLVCATVHVFLLVFSVLSECTYVL